MTPVNVTIWLRKTIFLPSYLPMISDGTAIVIFASVISTQHVAILTKYVFRGALCKLWILTYLSFSRCTIYFCECLKYCPTHKIKVAILGLYGPLSFPCSRLLLADHRVLVKGSNVWRCLSMQCLVSQHTDFELDLNERNDNSEDNN